jgi:hypothetical protein
VVSPDDVLSAPSEDPVPAGPSEQRVVAPRADEPVGAGATDAFDAIGGRPAWPLLFEPFAATALHPALAVVAIADDDVEARPAVDHTIR